MKLESKEVLRIANLARLKLAPEELGRFSEALATILDFVGKLEELDLDDVEPMAHVIDVSNAFRSDEPLDSLEHDRALANAPSVEGPYFKVPKVL